MLVLEGSYEHSGDDTTVFACFDFCLEQVEVETEPCQNSDDILTVSSKTCFSENVERDCEEVLQHSGSTLVARSCGANGERCCGETRFRIFLCSSSSE